MHLPETHCALAPVAIPLCRTGHGLGSRPRLAGSGNSRSIFFFKKELTFPCRATGTGLDPVPYGIAPPTPQPQPQAASPSRALPSVPAHSLIPSASAGFPFPDPLPPPIQFRTPHLAAAAGHVQVRHHPHLLLRGRRGVTRRRLPARLHLARQGPGRLGAGDAPALARARGRPRRRPAPEPRRRVPPRARQPRALRHELRHRRARRRLPLPPLAPRLPHRLPRLHARLARPLLPPRRAPRPLRPRRRRRLRPRRARRHHARPPPPHRRHRQHPLLAEHRPRPRPPARRAAQGRRQRRRRGRPLVRAGVTAAVALGSECGHSAPCCDPVPVLTPCFQVFLQLCKLGHPHLICDEEPAPC